MKTSLRNIPPVNAPRWCFNGHIHTIARSLFGNSQKPPCERLEISTPDDDFLDLDVYRSNTDRGAVALFHGLEGSTDRYYMAELMQVLYLNGYSFAGVNFRSCGSRLNKKRRFYHSGETDDYRTVFRWMRSYFSNEPLAAVGFSLGGNALLKYLGEEGTRHPVEAAAAVSVPYDLEAGSRAITNGFNRIYDFRFIRTLKKKLVQKKKTYPDLPEFTGTTLYDFDEQVTSRIHGYENALDYYQKCSSNQYLPDITVPTLLIHSQDDPLCPVDMFPAEIAAENEHIDYILTGEGGHVGFQSRKGKWLNRVITEYLSQKICD